MLIMCLYYCLPLFVIRVLASCQRQITEMQNLTQFEEMPSAVAFRVIEFRDLKYHFNVS